MRLQILTVLNFFFSTFCLFSSLSRLVHIVGYARLYWDWSFVGWIGWIFGYLGIGHGSSRVFSEQPRHKYFNRDTTQLSNLDVILDCYVDTPFSPLYHVEHQISKNSEKKVFVKSIVREVCGFSPYEKRVMELLRNSKDKKARKLTKKRVSDILLTFQPSSN